MKVVSLPIDGAFAITPKIFTDDRGSFRETFAASRYREAGIADSFVQDNLSISHRHVLRGLHGDARMAKLVQVLNGSAFDVIADVRPKSSTYLRWYGLTLRDRDGLQVYIPAGCLHGFLALDEHTVLLYKQSAEYDPAGELGIAWNDPDLAIAWPLDGQMPLLSPKDAANPTLRTRSLL